MGRNSRGVVLFTVLVAAAIIELSWGAKPSLMILPTQSVQTKSIGQNVLLTCRANVEDKSLITDLQWSDPNGRIIQNEGGADPRIHVEKIPGGQALGLLINKLMETDSGYYNCSASYANSEKLTAWVRIDSIFALTWEDAPPEQNAILHSNYKIRCKVTANPSPVINWMKNGKGIPTDSGHYVLESDGLLIQKATEADDGTYSCRAMVIDTGEVGERNIRVQVNTPPMFEEMLSPIEVIEGEAASIICKAKGKPQPKFTWIKGATKEDLSKTDRFTVNELTGELVILRVAQDDHGEFKCIARNPADTIEKTIKLSVVVKPKIVAYRNITVPVRKEAKLHCSASGRPLPTITFRKLSPPINYVIGPQPNEDRITVDNRDDIQKGEKIGSFIVSKVIRSDDGLYACVATNKGGEALSNGHMTVEFPPTFTATAPKNESWSWRNNPVNITCLAESIPNATISWRFNDREIERDGVITDLRIKKYGNGPMSTLRITPLDNKHYGAWKCIATNIHGKAEHTIWLKEANVPGEILQSKLEVITATTITFSFIGPANNGGLPTKAFAVQYKEERNTWKDARNKTWPVDSPYILEGLEPQTTYNFRFAAQNDVGFGNWAKPETHTMPKRSFPEEPRILNPGSEEEVFISPYSDRLELRWGIPPDNGEPIDKYTVKFCPVRRSNGEWEDSNSLQCDEVVLESHEHSGYELRALRPDTHYKVEVRAHNSIGYSTPAQVYVKTAPDPRNPGKFVTPLQKSEPMLSSAVIVGIVVASLLLMLIIIDASCCIFNNAGIFYLLCKKPRKKQSEEDHKLKSDEKEPLKDMDKGRPFIQESVKRDMAVEYDGKKSVSRTNFVGKDSAV